MTLQQTAPIRLGMVGGGIDAFIGGVHRIAARLDNRFELVAGALSSSSDKARRSGEWLGLAEDRVYTDFRDMARREAARPDGIEAVAIVTPNHMHFPVACAFLEAGIHVICDKPMTASLQEARELVRIAQTSNALFSLTHNYTAYPLVREARHLVESGAIGNIRVVHVEYAQDWLTEPLETTGQKQASWRSDPSRSGIGGCISDIGTHAFNLLSFITGLKTNSLCADMSSFGPDRLLDDNVNMLLHFEGGARGMLWASQVAPGNENHLGIRIYGDKGGIEWQQENPNQLWFTPFGAPKQLLTRGGAGVSHASNDLTRIPAGHPEGYLEAFANLYGEIATLIRSHQLINNETTPSRLIPSVFSGLDGLQFIAAAIASKGRWVELSEVGVSSTR